MPTVLIDRGRVVPSNSFGFSQERGRNVHIQRVVVGTWTPSFFLLFLLFEVPYHRREEMKTVGLEDLVNSFDRQAAAA